MQPYRLVSFDGACPLGPWIVPARDIGDPRKLSISLAVNGVVKQHSSTAQMIFTVAEQIAYLSSRLTLHPGDVVSIDVERIGTLTNVMA